MDRLRSPGGCPWDARQTHASLVEYLVEETYETVEAIESADDAGLREELGDLLLQVVFHSRIAQESNEPWDIDDVAGGIVDKLVARHPHVFGNAVADTPEQVEANWHAAKRREKGRDSVTDGIPSSLPALVRAGKVINRSVAVPNLPPLPAAESASSAMSGIDSDTDLGDLLLAIVEIARDRELDAESALRLAIGRRVDVIRSTEETR